MCVVLLNMIVLDYSVCTATNNNNYEEFDNTRIGFPT